MKKNNTPNKTTLNKVTVKNLETTVRGGRIKTSCLPSTEACEKLQWKVYSIGFTCSLIFC